MELPQENKARRQPSYMRDTVAHEKKANRGKTMASTEGMPRWAPVGRSPRAQTVFLSSPLLKDQGTPPTSPGGSSHRSRSPWTPGRTRHSTAFRGRSASPSMSHSSAPRRPRSEHGTRNGDWETPRSEGGGRRAKTVASRGAKRTPRSPMSEGGRRTPESTYSEEDFAYNQADKDPHPKRASTLAGMPRFMMRDPDGKPSGKQTPRSKGKEGCVQEDPADEERRKERLAYKQMSETVSQPLWPSTTSGTTARPRAPGGRSRGEAQRMRRMRSVSPVGRENAGTNDGTLEYTRRAITPNPWSSNEPIGASVDNIPRFMWRTEAWEGKVHDQEKLRTVGSLPGLPPIPHSTRRGDSSPFDPHSPTPMTVATDKMARRGEHPFKGSKAPWRPAGRVEENGRPHQTLQHKLETANERTKLAAEPTMANGRPGFAGNAELEAVLAETPGVASDEVAVVIDNAKDEQQGACKTVSDPVPLNAPLEGVPTTKPKRLRPVKMMKKVAKFVGLSKMYQKNSHTTA